MNSWKEFVASVLALGYTDEEEVKGILRRQYGNGGGASRDYKKWYELLKARIPYRIKAEYLKRWDIIWRQCPKRPPPLRYGTLKEMNAHIERYKDYGKTDI